MLAMPVGGLEHISWVVTASTLVTAVITPVRGKLGDLAARKSAYLASIAVFVAGSALCGASQSMTQLIAFPVVQAIGAGGIGAGAFALIGSLVPPRERGRYQGVSAAVMRSAPSAARCSAGSSPATWTGAGPSTSTCRSAWSPWCGSR
ncbi:MFS transporter [Streptomyces sp. NPDC127106]|uniref:MFS transporter n=1 Tax=Streptomyces sp. NPDC127106 TaxID=3345360 RepID=UPI00363C0755